MDEAIEQNAGIQREPLIRPVRKYPREKEVKHRIKIWMAYCLIVFAVMIDFAELGTTYIGVVVIGGILSNLIAAFATTVFWIWFLILGVPYSANTKRFGVMVVTHVAEYVPVADALPFWFMWTIGMAVTIGMVRMEDKGEKPTILGGILEILSITAPSPGISILKKITSSQLVLNKIHNVKYAKQINSMDRLGSVESGTKGNSKTLDLRNKNTHSGYSLKKRPPTNQSAQSQQKLNRLQSDISRYQAEIQQKERELAQKEQHYKENEDGFTRGLEIIRSTRDINKEEEARYFREHSSRMTSFYQDIDKLKSSIAGLKKLISQLQNEISISQSKTVT